MLRRLIVALGSGLFLLSSVTSAAYSSDETVWVSPRSWYSDYLTTSPMYLSPNGEHLLLYFEFSLVALDLKSGEMLNITGFVEENLGASRSFASWLSHGRIRVDYRAEEGWLQIALNPESHEFEHMETDGVAINIQRAQKSCESVGVRRIGEEFGLHYVNCDAEETLLLQAPVLGLAISPNGQRAAWTRLNQSGGNDLFVFEATSGETVLVKSALDGSYASTNIAFTADSDAVLLSLASPDPVDLGAREAPQADRRLKIYQFDIETKAVDLVHAVADQDVTLLGAVDNSVYYQYTKTDMKAVVIPFAGGDARQASDNHTTSFPFWHPSGDRLSVTYGDWRISDWVMNWDLGSYRIGADAGIEGPLKPEITGHHEDYGLNWSPDGRWMAYHSHRSSAPVAAYASEGSSDDIWLKPVGGSTEIRLTQQGNETIQPDWASDSQRLVYATMNPTYKPYIVTIDVETGEPLSVGELVVEGMADTAFFSASWSQTRAEIALEEMGEGLERRLWLVGEDGADPRLLASYEMLTSLAGTDFTPDGNWVLFAGLANGHHQLFKAATDGSEVIQITTGDEEYLAPQVSPDGRWIAAIHYDHKRLFGHFEMNDLETD